MALNFFPIFIPLYHPTIILPVIALLLDSRRNFGFNFIRKQTPGLKNAYAYPPNSDEPIVAKRKSRFIGELKIEDSENIPILFFPQNTQK
jgi:hypothetical protein